MYTINYYSVLKKNEIIKISIKQMLLESVIPSEVGCGVGVQGCGPFYWTGEEEEWMRNCWRADWDWDKDQTV